MSVSLCKMIEVLDNTGKWHLIQWNNMGIDEEKGSTDCYTVCGLALRDELNWWSPNSVAQTFPEDASDEAKAFRDDWLAKAYGYGEHTRFFYGTLDKLQEMYYDKQKRWKENLLKEIQIQKEDNISKKLDNIEQILLKGAPKTKKKKDSGEEESDNDSMMEYYLDEEFWDIVSLGNELSNLYTLAREISGKTYIDESKVRIIMWYC